MDVGNRVGFLARRKQGTPIGTAMVRCVLAICLMLMTVSAHGQNWLGIWNAPENELWMTNFDKLDSPSPHRFKPLLGFEAGVVVLQRTHPDTFDLVSTDGTLGPIETIATSDILETDGEAGEKFTVTMYNLTRHVPGLDMDFGYFSVDGIGAHQEVNASGFNTTDVLPSFFGGIPATPEPSYTLITNSDLDSHEWMMGYRPWARIRFMMGLRWLDLSETFDVLETDELPAISGFYSTAKNDAFGWQIGGEAILWSGEYVRVHAKVKYASLDNDVTGTAEAENIQFAFSGDETSSLVDLEIGASVPMGDWASFKVAYQGLFMSDAAGAFEQSNLQSFFVPASQVPQFHEIEWHGVHFSLGFLW